MRAGCGVTVSVMFTKYAKNMPRKRWENYLIHGHYIGIGSLMYANSCLNNADYVSHRTSDKRLRFIWVASLSVQGHEITVNYGGEYFEDMSCECEKCRPGRFSLAWFQYWCFWIKFLKMFLSQTLSYVFTFIDKWHHCTGNDFLVASNNDSFTHTQQK